MSLSALLRIVAGLSLLVPAAQAQAEDWPVWQHDARRSGFSAEELDPRTLTADWTFQGPLPQPAWHGPAKWDAYARIRNLPSMRSYDLAFHTTIAGGLVYFATSTDQVYCLDAEHGGQLRWMFCADGPVRIAPTVADGRVLIGSDDGFAYCLAAETGQLLWKFRPAETETAQRLLNNGRFISPYPCRTGVMVNESTGWCAFGLVPWQPTYLCAVDLQTGRPDGPGCFVKTLTDRTLEGAPAMSSRLVLFPQGRVAPQVFQRDDGRDLGPLKKSGGGSIVVVSLDSGIFHGPAAESRRGAIGRTPSETLEMVASHGRGSALIVSDRVSYMLADDELIASDLTTHKPLFQVPCRQQLCLAGAGAAVFAGGSNELAAYDSATGERLWSAPVDGRVYGISIANGRVYASTDTGAITVFRCADVRSADAASSDPESIAVAPTTRDASVQPEADSRLLGHWRIDARHIHGRSVTNLAGGLPAMATAGVVMKPAGLLNAIEFDGSDQSLLITPNHREAKLPTQNMSVEAWVRVDEPLEWGGLVGAVQDNGDFERGWVLGYRNSKFSIGLCGADGNRRLTYLTAANDFVLRRWCHVCATYNGETLRLFVNGEPAAESTQQRGPILYPPQAFFEIGAYHDKDEHHRLTGAIHEVRLYDAVLSPDEIVARHNSLRDAFPVPLPTVEPALGPWLQFAGRDPETHRGTAVVRWHTAELCPTWLELDRSPDGSAASEVFFDPAPRRQHRVRLTDLPHNTVLHYRLQMTIDGQTRQTRDYECDTFFDYTLADALTMDAGANDPDAIDAAAGASAANVAGIANAVVDARTVLARSGIDRGLAIVIGLNDGRMIRELVRESALRVVGFDDDAERVERLRTELIAAGRYGSRISIHYVADLNSLPIVGRCANLLLTERLSASRSIGELPTIPMSMDEVQRLLRPAGGEAMFGSACTDRSTDRAAVTAVLRDWSDGDQRLVVTDDANGVWLQWKSDPLPGTGTWTHLYGDPDNSAFSGETLGGARSAQQLRMQWIGRPGPRYQSDRSGRKPSPLAASGRLFLQGLDRIVALDSYNGSVLWSLEVPGFQRFNVARDSSNWCADMDHVFAVVRDRVWQIEAATGQIEHFHVVGPHDRDGRPTDWSFVARTGDLLIGSATQADSGFDNYWGKDGWHDERSGESTFQVCSDRLFARRIATAEADSAEPPAATNRADVSQSESPLWTWSGGVVLNSSITIADGVVYFVECRHPEIMAGGAGRIGRPELWTQQYLVALDASTGSKRWERPIEPVADTLMFSMAHAAGTTGPAGDASPPGRLVLVSSSHEKFHVATFPDDGGAQSWQQTVGWFEGKGDHGKAMSRPAIVGDRIFLRPQVLSLKDGSVLDISMPGGGCGTYACTSHALFFRSGTVTMWDSHDGSATSFPRLRPDCWLSTIPADGMLLSPEGGGGCSCGSWLETSIGFMPDAGH